MFLSAICTLLLNETKGKAMEDLIHVTDKMDRHEVYELKDDAKGTNL